MLKISVYTIELFIIPPHYSTYLWFKKYSPYDRWWDNYQGKQKENLLFMFVMRYYPELCTLSVFRISLRLHNTINFTSKHDTKCVCVCVCVCVIWVNIWNKAQNTLWSQKWKLENILILKEIMEGHKTYSWQGRWFKDIGLLSLGPKSYLRTPSLKPLNEQFTQISPKSFFFW